MEEEESEYGAYRGRPTTTHGECPDQLRAEGGGDKRKLAGNDSTVLVDLEQR